MDTKITRHIYSAVDRLPILKDSNKIDSVGGFLTKGEWMGILQEQAEYIHVITARFDGWVEKKLCISSTGSALGINVKDDKYRYQIG